MTDIDAVKVTVTIHKDKVKQLLLAHIFNDAFMDYSWDLDDYSLNMINEDEYTLTNTKEYVNPF